ncbi:hypothetical protein, partial [Sporolactobacillus vineae]|uniref:hypothetical protein n=1 Tax=Sporolactobacillus vineae TaxID=444463 RepID=UPI001EE6746D
LREKWLSAFFVSLPLHSSRIAIRSGTRAFASSNSSALFVLALERSLRKPQLPFLTFSFIRSSAKLN